MKKHINKFKAYFLAHKAVGIILLIVILGVGYYGYKKYTSTAGVPRYITAKVEKGDVVVSVSGSGQVSALNQVDVKAKASGDVVYISATDGQKIGAGGLIAKLDDKDAQKSVRDAQINLESAQISLSKLKIEKSAENLNSDLAKTYDDGLNTVSDVFLDLPTIMNSLDNMFFKSFNSSGQWYASWYADQTSTLDHDKAIALKENFIDSYNKAKSAYDTNFDAYKTISRTSDSAAVESLMTQTYNTSKLISDTIKNANSYIDFVNNSMQASNFTIPSIIATHKASLNTYTGQTNSHLVNLLSVITNIKTYKDAFLNSDLDVQSSELSVKQRENALQDAQDKLADYYIRAPFAGTVTKINIKKSDSIGTGTVVTTLLTTAQLAEISMNEVDVAKIKLGQKASLTFDAIPDLEISGVVSDIDTLGAVSQGVVTYIVKVSFGTQDARVKAGMSVSASIITDTKNGVLVVPNSAIKSRAGKSYVEINPPLLTRVPVEIGLANDTTTEIISGIKEGDEIVTRTILGTAAAATTAAPSLFGSTGGNRAGATTRVTR